MNNLYALQIKNVVDNETVTAKISSIDVTRILVQSDRIKSVKGIKGAYTRENDEKNGEIYIQPTQPYQERAFTLLIETEQGRHFTLLLTPTSSPSQTLMLVPKGAGKERAAHFEESSTYELTLMHLVRAMRNEQIPEGYSLNHIESKKSFPFGNGLKIKLKTIYQGFNLRGEVYEMTNTTAYSIMLNERDLYKFGTRAVSLETLQIPAFGKITFYRVADHA